MTNTEALRPGDLIRFRDSHIIGRVRINHGPIVNGDGSDGITWVQLVAGLERGGDNLHPATYLSRIPGNCGVCGSDTPCGKNGCPLGN